VVRRIRGDAIKIVTRPTRSSGATFICYLQKTNRRASTSRMPAARVASSDGTLATYPKLVRWTVENSSALNSRVGFEGPGPLNGVVGLVPPAPPKQQGTPPYGGEPEFGEEFTPGAGGPVYGNDGKAWAEFVSDAGQVLETSDQGV